MTKEEIKQELTDLIMGNKNVNTDIEETVRKVKKVKIKQRLLHYLRILD